MGCNEVEWRHVARVTGLVVSSSEHSNEPLGSTIHNWATELLIIDTNHYDAVLQKCQLHTDKTSSIQNLIPTW
jgi:hypothetical protein